MLSCIMCLLLSTLIQSASAQDDSFNALPPPPPDFVPPPEEDDEMDEEDEEEVDETAEGEDRPSRPGAATSGLRGGSFGGASALPGNLGSSGTGSFGRSKGKVQFEVIEGVFLEKGQKRPRGKKP